MLFALLLHRSHIWEKSGSWHLGQNALGQLDCKIVKSMKGQKIAQNEK